MADSQLAHATGCKLREHYLRRKRQCVGPRYRLPDEWVPEDRWDDLGQFCLELRARPTDLIDAIFRLGKKHRNGPLPNMLRGMASRAWDQWCRDQPEAQRQGGMDAQTRIDGPTSSEEYYKTLLDGAVAYVRKCTRGAEPGSEPFEAALLGSLVSLPSWIRVILAPTNLEVWYEYGLEACRAYRNNVELVQWLAHAGYPIMDILNRPTPPEPDYFRMLRANGLNPDEYYR